MNLPKSIFDRHAEKVKDFKGHSNRTGNKQDNANNFSNTILEFSVVVFVVLFKFHR